LKDEERFEVRGTRYEERNKVRGTNSDGRSYEFGAFRRKVKQSFARACAPRFESAGLPAGRQALSVELASLITSA
jgi:hypothetical protein